MASATSVLLKRLLDDELAAIESEVGHSRADTILKSLDERGTAQQLIEGQYSGRYPLELLQNADDSVAERRRVDSTAPASIRFELTRQALIVADTGTGFSEDNVSGICSIGRSPKDPRTSIGYKGIGFKSVGEIAARPQIVSQGARFMFDAARVRNEISARVPNLRPDQRFPTYAFPFPVTDGDLGDDAELVEALQRDGYATVIRLPLDAVRHEAVEAHLRHVLAPRLLLLLDGVDELELHGTSGDFSAKLDPDSHAGHTEVLLKLADGPEEYWIVFRSQLDIPDRSRMAELGDKWEEVAAARIAIAAPGPGVDIPRDGFPLHVFFPTSEGTGLPFIVHGDFAVDLDRRHASQKPAAVEYNQWLGEAAARFVADAVAPNLGAIL